MDSKVIRDLFFFAGFPDIAPSPSEKGLGMRFIKDSFFLAGSPDTVPSPSEKGLSEWTPLEGMRS